MVPALPATLGTPDDPPHSSSRPLHLPFLLPLPHSNEVFPGHTPQTPHVSVSPLLASLFLPSFTPSCPHTQSLCPICRASASAPPGRLFSRGGFSQGCALPSGSARSSPAVLGPRSPRSLRRGSAAAGLRRPALCAVIGRDSVCRCRPMMERGGTGGPAPLGAGMRRRRSQRDSGSESPPSPPSNARLPAAAAASRGRWAAA